jgi:hypothetical protein
MVEMPWPRRLALLSSGQTTRRTRKKQSSIAVSQWDKRADSSSKCQIFLVGSQELLFWRVEAERCWIQLKKAEDFCLRPKIIMQAQLTAYFLAGGFMSVP